ncbi:MAG: sensor histidine kinase [Clostridia bacterium]|nr:sensor histidine kinase [Clostridia bacterium]
MRRLAGYLRYRAMPIALWLVSLAVLAVLSALGGLAPVYARYAMLLISFFFLLLMLLGAAGYFRRLRALAALRETADRLSGALPEPGNAVEAAYQALLEELLEDGRRLRRDTAAAREDSLGYYTLWVHQIKTPIAAMRLLLQGEDDPQSRALGSELFKVEQYADLALRYAKMQEIVSDVIVERFPLMPVVREAVKKYGLLFVHKRLGVHIEETELQVTSDRRWLQFILEQLLSNAVKYTRRGGVSIGVEEGALVIADTGQGIRPEDLPRIFERGYTGYTGRLDARASGIGLYLVKRAADALRIDIRAESAPEAGTRMILRFPEETEILE